MRQKQWRLYGTIGRLDADMRVFPLTLAPGPGLRCIACGWRDARKELKSGRNDRVRGPETEFAGQATALP
jgi:hypothetical protein